MTAVPVRALPDVPATVTVTDAGPLPAAGVSVSHGTLLAAVQGHAGVVAMATLAAPPAAAAT